MAKVLLAGAFLVLALSLAVAACSTADATTTTAKAAGTTKTTHKTAAATSSTSSTLPVETWTPVAYEQGTPGLTYAGGWTYSSAADASKGAFVFADKSGAAMTFHFVGTYCAWLAKTSDAYGKATVSVDDGAAVTVDLYSKSVVWRHLVWETKTLPFGDHTVKIAWTGKKRAAGKGTCINVDSVEITGALVGRYQQNDKHFEYSGKWSTTKNDSASGGSFTLAKTSRSSVTATFTGIGFRWYAKKGPAYGKARVIVDDEDPVTVDLYGAEDAWKQMVWDAGRLEMGAHVVTIKWTGLKNVDATGTYIDVDSFEIAGAVQ